MDSFGTAISMSLQYGVPLEVLVNKFAHTRFEPMGHTKNPDIRIAKSLVDYIFRWLAIKFIAGYREAQNGHVFEKQEGTTASGGANGAANGTVVAESTPTVAATPAPASKASADASAAMPQGKSTANGQAPTVSMARLHQAGVMMWEPPVGSEADRDRQFAQFQSDAPSCDNCGAITVRNGNCYLCHNCGNSMGCS